MPEINIICIRQEKKLKISTTDLKVLKCNKRQKDVKGYQDNFHCMGALLGNWYQVLSKRNYESKDYICGAYDIIEGDICDNPAEYYKMRLVDKSDIEFYRDNPGYLLQSVAIKQSVKSSLLQVLNASLQASEIGMIAFLVRESTDPPEKIFGCIGLDEFTRRLDAHEIYFNAVYIIKI